MFKVEAKTVTIIESILPSILPTSLQRQIWFLYHQYTAHLTLISLTSKTS